MNKILIAVLALLIACSSFARDDCPAPSPWLPDGSGGITTDKSVTMQSATIGNSASGLVVVSDGDGIVLTSADWGKFIWMTGAGEVQLPDGTASDIGKYIIVGVRDASEQVEIAVTDITELIVLTDGTALDANDEADMATNKSSKTTFVYLETGKWYAFGTPITDGGAAD